MVWWYFVCVCVRVFLLLCVCIYIFFIDLFLIFFFHFFFLSFFLSFFSFFYQLSLVLLLSLLLLFSPVGDFFLPEENKNERQECSIKSLKNNTNINNEIYFLVNILHIPISWLYESAAYRCGYAHNFFKQVQHLNYANKWYEAKEIVCRKLAPMVILKSSSAGDKLRELLLSMQVDNSSGSKEDIWNDRSDILLSFLNLKHHVDEIIKTQKQKILNSNKIDSKNDEYYEKSEIDLIAQGLDSTINDAKLLLERIRILNNITLSLQSTSNNKNNSSNMSSNNIINSRNSNNQPPSIETATLINMGTYLFDLIDRLTWRNEKNASSNDDNNINNNTNNNTNKNNINDSVNSDNNENDLYQSIAPFEDCLDPNFPVLGDHLLLSLNRHSAMMFREAASNLSKSYCMSINRQIST